MFQRDLLITYAYIPPSHSKCGKPQHFDELDVFLLVKTCDDFYHINPPSGSRLVVVWVLACPKYVESYARGGFDPCSASFGGERVSHASKVSQGRAKLNGSQDVGCQYGSTVPPTRGTALGGCPALYG